MGGFKEKYKNICRFLKISELPEQTSIEYQKYKVIENIFDGFGCNKLTQYQKKHLERLFKYADVDEIQDNFYKFEQCANKTSVSLDNFILRFGKKHGMLFYDEHIKAAAKTSKERHKKIPSGSNSKLSIVYWEKYFSKDIAALKHKEYVDYYKVLPRNRNTRTPDQTSTRLEYWLKKTNGDEKEAKRLLSERQSTFSLEKCIAKYGEEEGRKKWQARQDKWQNTLTSKSPEEIIEIHNKKHVPLGKASKTSLKLFIPLYKLLRNKYGVLKRDIYVGAGSRKEFFLYSNKYKKCYFYDFCIWNSFIIEFHGKVFHIKNVDNNNNLIYGLNASDVMEKQKQKKETAVNAGYKYMELFEEDGIEQNYNKIIVFIKEYYGK